MMSLGDQLIDYINAAFSGIWVLTSEPDEAERELTQLCRQQEWNLAIWDIANGMRLPGQQTTDGGGDPLAALRALPALAAPNKSSVLVMHNYHRFLNNPEVVQTVFTQLLAGKERRTFIVVLAPVVQLPPELEKLFLVVEHALPDRDQLLGIAQGLLPETELATASLGQVLDAAAGLTRYEAEAAFALSLARHDQLKPDAIWELKASCLKKNSLLTLHRGRERFADLGGLDSLKDFCRRALRPDRPKQARPRGVLLVSPPGCGKSAFCKALGSEMGRPTLLLDLGSLMNSLVGQSEANLRQALKIAEAMSPVVLMVDELEKALSGVGSSGDSGVSTRMFGTLLTWLSDHESDVFFVGTSNDISKLPPEFTRAERFDGVFFVDLPTTKDKDLIWQMYRQHFDVKDEQKRPDDTDWTGAEIRSCCRLSALLDVPLTQAARNVVPVAVTAAEQVERLRTWASGRCLSANEPGVYQRQGQAPKSGRKVTRPSSN